MPEKTEAQKKAQKKYMEKFMVAQVRMERDKYVRIQAHAEAQGESVNGFINRAIDNQISQDRRKGPSEAPESTKGQGVVSLRSGTIKTAQEAAHIVGETIPQFVERAILEQAKRDEDEELAMEGSIELKHKSLELGHLNEKMRKMMEESLASTEAELRVRRSRRKGPSEAAQGPLEGEKVYLPSERERGQETGQNGVTAKED